MVYPQVLDQLTKSFRFLITTPMVREKMSLTNGRACIDINPYLEISWVSPLIGPSASILWAFVFLSPFLILTHSQFGPRL